MGLSKEEVFEVASYLDPLFERAGARAFIIFGDASVLLRGINVNSDNIDIVMIGNLVDFIEVLYEDKGNARIEGVHSMNSGVLLFQFNGVLVRVMEPDVLGIPNMGAFDVLKIRGTPIKVRKIEDRGVDLIQLAKVFPQ